MNKIKKIVIKGFKLFEDFEMYFNSGTNILIGDNESGKSTILEAIEVVLNKKYLNYDKYIVRDILNRNIVKKFEEGKDFTILPKIEIYLFLDLDCDNNYDYYGEIKINNEKIEDFGIKFTCQFNDEFRDDLITAILDGKIPYDYYEMSWETFKGKPYNLLKKPLRYLSIDNSKLDGNNTYNHYNKHLFLSKYDNLERLKISNDFRNEINDLMRKIGANKLDNNSEFGIDNKKVILENIITVLEDNISLENKGKGRENLIKTEIALNKNSNDLDLISIEEPENHLSHINLRKMLEHIKQVNNKDDIQLLVTTHNSLIVNTLNLSNVIWIDNKKPIALKDLYNSKDGKNAIKFFEKADNLNLLQFILSPKVILVEGPTEYLLIQKAYEEIVDKLLTEEEKLQRNRSNIETEGIEIISCGGVGYSNYLEIAKCIDKRVAVITDNDFITNPNKISQVEEFNQNNKNIQIFTDSNIDNWTWEVCLYNLNKDILEEKIPLKKDAKYLYECKNAIYEGCLGKMLNQKTEVAYFLIKEDISLNYPKYIEECIKWIRK